MQICRSPCPLSIFKGGSTIPVKFQLKDANGNIVLSSGVVIWLKPVLVGPTTAPIDEPSITAQATSGNPYRWDGSQYIYNWSTKGVSPGYYWMIGVQLDDGQTHVVYIGLR